MRKRSNRSWHLGLIAALAAPLGTQAIPADGYPGIAPLFADDSILEVTIEAPMKALMDVRPDKAYLDGSFIYIEADGTERKLGLKLQTRGNYRRDKEHCDFAPIRLNFRKKQVSGTLIDGQDKLKLVTHCQNTDFHYDQIVAREYLAYRLLHELTGRSFATRPLRITYINMQDGSKRTRFGFVIEDVDAVAKRNGMKAAKAGLITPEYLEPNQAILIHLFQYMTGNTEYSLTRSEPDKNCCHNVDLMSRKGESLFVPLAYDFDFSGMVNAPYAEPNPRYKLRNVRTRLFKGRCKYDEQLQTAIQHFHDKKDDLYGLIDELEPLSSSSKSSVKWYIDSFYERIADPESVQKWLIDKCYDPAS
jgi:hypothetical protein